MAVVLNQTTSNSTKNSTPSIARGLDELFADSSKAAALSPTITSGARTAQWIELVPNAEVGSISRTIAADSFVDPSPITDLLADNDISAVSDEVFAGFDGDTAIPIYPHVGALKVIRK
jgi:hypothetical protein